MKALRTILAAVILFVGATAANAQSMSIAAMRSNARFLTDRMAYTLGIADPYLIDEMYRINYDYIWGVNDYLDDVAMGYYYDDYMSVVEARDIALRRLLGVSLWNRVINYNYFYRPITFVDCRWRFSVYDYDRYGVNRYYYSTPRVMVTYTGGHFFNRMAPRVVYQVSRGHDNRRYDNSGYDSRNYNNGRGYENRSYNNNRNYNNNGNYNYNRTRGNAGVRSGSNVGSSSRYNGTTRSSASSSAYGNNARSSASAVSRSGAVSAPAARGGRR